MTHPRFLLPTTAVALLLGLAACGSAEVEPARGKARRDAEKAIEEGRPSLLFIGLPAVGHSPLDPETGLLRYSTGCVVSDERCAAIEAHNETILAALRDGRLAGMTFEDRALTRAAARAPFAEGAGTPLAPEVPVDLVEGAYRVEIAPRNLSGDVSPYVFVTEVATGKRRELIYVGEPRARVALLHDDRTLLVRDDAFGTVRSFDLARGLELQVFADGS